MTRGLQDGSQRMLALLLRRFYCSPRRDVQVTHISIVLGERWGYFEDIVVCLFNPFVGKHFDGGFLCVWVAITETPSEDPFTVTDTQDAEVAYFVHTARVDASTINRVNVSCTFNNKKNRRASLFKVKQDGSSNLTFIRRL